MTTPSERTRALIQAKELLESLLSSEEWPTLPPELRQQSRVVLRHFPRRSDLERLNRLAPEQYGPAPPN